ncbi:hypothetical protein Tsubulata_038625 [Turnera subulata]|uniref:Uncharacterized protein n=1 Tax=Turnera subulata TaxID=218843 RepID=A0A9Q0JA47_9ROSI|nr:hypothetical protein Tsubulata_038625 [Turnera subulata]
MEYTLNLTQLFKLMQTAALKIFCRRETCNIEEDIVHTASLNLFLHCSLNILDGRLDEAVPCILITVIIAGHHGFFSHAFHSLSHTSQYYRWRRGYAPQPL